jgi:hypothetical protein
MRQFQQREYSLEKLRWVVHVHSAVVAIPLTYSITVEFKTKQCNTVLLLFLK